MHSVSGGCHCGNLWVQLLLTRSPDAYQPRRCDCDFCQKHGASYLSDARGSVRIQIRDAAQRRDYRQGSGQAQFLLCARCGVLIGVLYGSDSQLYAAINARILDERGQFGVEQSVSPQTLSSADKVQRWRDVWFSDVSLTVD